MLLTRRRALLTKRSKLVAEPHQRGAQLDQQILVIVAEQYIVTNRAAAITDHGNRFDHRIKLVAVIAQGCWPLFPER